MLEKNKKIIGTVLLLILVVCLFPPTRICRKICANYYPSFIYNVVYDKIVPEIVHATYIAWDILLLQIFIITIIMAIILLVKHK